jgi:hypothetical protein
MEESGRYGVSTSLNDPHKKLGHRINLLPIREQRYEFLAILEK